MPAKPIFEKPNVLVTGGAGFIGSFLCEKLLNDSRVVCVDNFSTASETNIDHLLKNPDFEFIRADFNEPIDFANLPELERFQFKFQGFQEIYHLACPTSAKKFEELRRQTLLANSVGMRNALDLAVANKAKFFFASSSVIYGKRPEDGHLLKEEEYGYYDHLTPRSCYDEGKRWAETMCYTYKQVHNIDVRIGRIFRTFGPRMLLNDGQMVPDFIQNALDGNDLTIYGTDAFRSSFVYVSDVVDAIIRLMRLPKDPGPVNIGSDYDIRLVDVAKKIIEMTNSASKIKFEAPLLFMSELALPDLTRAKDDLGWLPLVTLETGLKRSIEYTVAHRGLLRPSLGKAA